MHSATRRDGLNTYATRPVGKHFTQIVQRRCLWLLRNRAMTQPGRAVTSWILEWVFSHLKAEEGELEDDSNLKPSQSAIDFRRHPARFLFSK